MSLTELRVGPVCVRARLKSWKRAEAKVELRGFGIAGIAVASAVAFLWAASGTQRERAVLTGVAPELVRASEARAAARPDDPEASRTLAQAYLDAQQPGLALAVLEALPATSRGPAGDARIRHVYARALLDQGRNDEALAVETSVVASCCPLAEGASPAPGCDAVVLAAAVRRTAILKELVALGVEDTRAHPEVSFVAYQNATREARVVTP
jgi:hypothetical protein